MENVTRVSGAAAPDDDEVPLTGTWPRMYAAVILCALAVMAAIAAFQAWNY
ncbi:MAG: hypothetical protein AB7O37_08555 [Vicinamibacteria bacterium]